MPSPTHAQCLLEPHAGNPLMAWIPAEHAKVGNHLQFHIPGRRFQKFALVAKVFAYGHRPSRAIAVEPAVSEYFNHRAPRKKKSEVPSK